MRLTDRRTDGQTDRIFIARPHLNSMQRGKNASLCVPGGFESVQSRAQVHHCAGILPQHALPRVYDVRRPVVTRRSSTSSSSGRGRRQPKSRRVPSLSRLHVYINASQVSRSSSSADHLGRQRSSIPPAAHRQCSKCTHSVAIR